MRLRLLAGILVSFLVALLLTGVVSAQKVRLRSKVDPKCVIANSNANQNFRYADIFGDGNIAVQGSYNCHGAFIYDLTNPDAAVLASVYDPVPTQSFLEAVVVGNRGYFGSGGTTPGLPANGDGVHIVDLSNPYLPKLLGKVNPSSGGGFTSVHEMVIWNNYLIENYNSFSNSTIKFIDVSNPSVPVLKWDLTPTDAWVHAMHVRGNRMYLSGWGGKIEIYDLSNIANQKPLLIGTITGDTTNHSTWTSEDGKYLFSCRETFDGDLRVYDVTQPSQPLLVKSIKAGDLGLNAITPHNPTVMGNYLYVAWYQAGLQVFDISDPRNPLRVGQYDTFEPTFAPPDDELARLAADEPWDMVCGAERSQNSLPTSYDGDWAVYPFLGQTKVLAGDMASGLFVLDASRVAVPVKNRVFDWDADGKTDLSVFRASDGSWMIGPSGSSPLTFLTYFGLSGDIPVSGDFNGDGRSDVAVFRPSNGTWYIKPDGNYYGVQWGLQGDIPVAADYDADGRTDIGVFRPSNGTWYIQQSTLGIKIVQWGQGGDKPITGDFEGDGKADIAVWRPSNGVWYVLQSSSSQGLYVGWGSRDLGDRALSADFDGNGRNDFAVYRPNEGTWYIYDPAATPAFRGFKFGLSDDMPIPSDLDGDGKTDLAIYRFNTGQWFWMNSSNDAVQVRSFGNFPLGQTGDWPIPASVQPQ